MSGYTNHNDSQNHHRHHDPYAHSALSGYQKQEYENHYQKSEYRNEGYGKGGSGLIKTSFRKSISHGFFTFFMATLGFAYLSWKYHFIVYHVGSEYILQFLSHMLTGAIPSVFLGIFVYRITKKMYNSEKPQIKRGAQIVDGKEMRKHLESQ